MEKDIAMTASPASSGWQPEGVRVLLIEDSPSDALLIRESLAEGKDGEFRVRCVADLSEGLQALSEAKSDVALVDLSLPDRQGVATFHRLHAEAPHVPVVVLTGLDDESVAMEAVHAGAQDFLVKGHVHGDVLRRSIHYAIERHQLHQELRQTAETLWATSEGLREAIERNANGTMIVDPDGIVRFVNPAAAELFGRERADMLGSLFGEPAMVTGAIELDLVRPQGKGRVVEMSVVTTAWEEEPAYLVSLRDITDRREAGSLEARPRRGTGNSSRR